MRADRELELQTEWCVGYDPRERWWKVEIDFPPALDEVFGVPINKQGAPKLAEYASLDLGQIAEREGFESEEELIEEWRHAKDPRVLLAEIKKYVQTNLSTIRGAIKQAAAGQRRRAGGRHDLSSAEARGTAATRKRQTDGHPGTSDSGEHLDTRTRARELVGEFAEGGLSDEEARTAAEELLTDGRKYVFQEVTLASSELFTVRSKAGVIFIGLNVNHPGYDNFVALLAEVDDTESDAALRTRLRRSHVGLKLLLESWARYEDELTAPPRKMQAQDARLDWGRVARDFFRDE
jgi:hypothetical protein